VAPSQAGLQGSFTIQADLFSDAPGRYTPLAHIDRGTKSARVCVFVFVCLCVCVCTCVFVCL
jgi:hypothetical protein